MSKQCDYPGCQESATIRCTMIGCNHEVCETHGNGAIEITPEEDAPICWGCDGKGWSAWDRAEQFWRARGGIAHE